MPMANRTPLYEKHDSLNARMFEFGGWEMPLWYTSIVDEHQAVRDNVGIFDVSHMGKILIGGKDCQNEFQKLISRNLAKHPPHKCIYTHLLDENGRIIDDMIVTIISSDRLFVVCNASTRENVIDWISRNGNTLVLKDVTTDYCCLAVQGPRTSDLLKSLVDSKHDPSPLDMKRYHACLTKLVLPPESKDPHDELSWAKPISMGSEGIGIPALLSRTGYTGEDGFEIFASKDETIRIWDSILEIGKGYGIKPIGLGARDTLRLEMCYLLSGHDFNGSQTPLEADAEFAIDWDHDFLGKKPLEEQKEQGGYSRLVAFESIDKGIPREGYRIMSDSGEEIGKVTSGTMSPTLKIGIGMGYVPDKYASPGLNTSYSIGTRIIKAQEVEKPFLKRK